MIDLLPELSFGDNVRPSQVTSHLREELGDWERRRRKLLLLGPSGFMLLATVVLFSGLSYDIRPFTPWINVFVPGLGAWAAYTVAIWVIYYRRIGLLRDAQVTTAAVIEKDTTTLWALGGSRRGSWSTPSARNVRESLNQSDTGMNEDAPHIVTVRLRFVPGMASEHLDWPDLRDEIPHCDVTKRVRGGGWGTFMGELKQGSLVTLLYSPDNPKRCRIVQRFRSHEDLE